MNSAPAIPFTTHQHTREEIAEKVRWAHEAIRAAVKQGDHQLFDRIDNLFCNRNFIAREALTLALIGICCDLISRLRDEGAP